MSFERTSKGWRRNPIRRSSFRTWILTPESAPNWGYSLADQAHEHLLGRLTSHPQRVIPRGVKENLIQYYKDRKDGSTPQPQLKEKLEVLRAMKRNDYNPSGASYEDRRLASRDGCG